MGELDMETILLKSTIFMVLLTTGILATNVKKCKNDAPFPVSVEVEGCEQTPCKVVKGSNVLMFVRFKGIKNNTTDIKAKVKAHIMGVIVPYELPSDVADVCSNLVDDIKCPIQKEEEVVYKFQFQVDRHYPEISADIEVSLNDKDETIACFMCGIKVKKRFISNEILL